MLARYAIMIAHGRGRCMQRANSAGACCSRATKTHCMHTRAYTCTGTAGLALLVQCRSGDARSYHKAFVCPLDGRQR